MEVNRDRPVLLDVKDLKMYFSSGAGGHKTTVKAVDGVSFSVRKGETFGLVGESGCGKTTLGRTIIRLYTPTAGEVRFNNRVISGKMDRELQKYLTSNIAMIFQDPIASLNPRMTVREIIAEGLKIKGIRDKNQVTEMVEQSLYRVGLLPEHATRYPHEFSGGQRQRIGIARALITEPSMVIADEPISALDVSIQAQVINVLNELKEQLHLTILFIAHDLSVVKYFSDRIGVMYAGKIVELADSDQLYRNPLHPYTQALISAIPIPDPRREKQRTCIQYVPQPQPSGGELPQLREVEPGHFVLCSQAEYETYRTSARRS